MTQRIGESGRLQAAAILLGVIALSSALRAYAEHAEVAFLLESIERSSCQFVRNGSAAPGNDAAAHLRRKLAAVKRELTPEEFIEGVASRSSMSGEPYLVRCTGTRDEPTGAWLRRVLADRRR